MSRKKNRKISLPPLHYIPLLLAITLVSVGAAAILSRYPGLIELELKFGANSGGIKIDGRQPSAALPSNE